MFNYKVEMERTDGPLLFEHIRYSAKATNTLIKIRCLLYFTCYF